MKKWENPKKKFCRFWAFAYSGSGGMYCGFAGRLYGTGAVAGRSRFGNRNTDRHSDNGKAKGTKTAAVTTKAPAPAVTPVSESGTYRDGTYTGTGTGFSGPITVQVVIEGGKIKDITIVSSTDDSPYLQNASALLKQIVAPAKHKRGYRFRCNL